ncbi:MAG: germination protein YpeB, partial [Clostridia bacterium]|nr:germination protein YpeB [Clostridia bacterium]
TKLHPELKIQRVRKALIPLDSGKEVLCYELRAERGPETYLIYINARTGAEERIFKVMKLPQGEVVM